MIPLSLRGLNPLPILSIAIPFVLYPIAAYIALRLLPERHRPVAFACVNMLLAWSYALVRGADSVRLHAAALYGGVATASFLGYAGLTAIHYQLLRKRLNHWIPIVFPIVLLIYIKYVPTSWSFGPLLEIFPKKRLPDLFLGISYMAFRLSYMVQEIRNKRGPMPTFAEYLSYAFYVPTLSLGPINPWENFHRSLGQIDRTEMPVSRSLERIVIGAVKYLFIGNLANQLSFDGLLADEWPHPLIDFPVAIAGYCVYLYCNFSGFCDMVIGVSGLLGIRVAENFDRPFRAQNLIEFWTRWHMTLSTYMRDMVFTPLSKALVRRFGPRSMPHCVAASMAVVFTLIGIWHGADWTFLLFGLWNAGGIVICHYYTQFLRTKVSRSTVAWINGNRVLQAAGTALTVSYFASGLFLMANSFAGMKKLLSGLGIL